MHERALRISATLAVAAMLLGTTAVFADTAPADGDGVTPDIQDFFEVGPIGTGGTVRAEIWFDLDCNTASHVDVGQTVVITLGRPDMPPGGSVTGNGTVIGPVPSGWPADGALCPAGLPSLRSATPASVTLMAPPDPGVYDYVVNYTRTLSPSGSGDATALRSLTRVFFELTVVPDAPPTLVLPADIEAEGDAPGGGHVVYGVSAVDPEDGPLPTPTCLPASGSFFALGETEVVCATEDSAGHGVSGSFLIDVVDTTPPVLVGVPTSVTLTSGDPGGTAADYVPPTATDAVAMAPVVVCAPAPGDLVAVGTTTVDCMAEDASGNRSRVAFPLTVSYVPPVTLAARFEAPIGPTNVVGGASGRTVPVKVRILRDQTPVTGGIVDLVLGSCDGGTTFGTPVALERQGDRWSVGLATDGLTGCVRATVRLDGAAAGSFDLSLGGTLTKRSRP
jgi:hypothetical protein